MLQANILIADRKKSPDHRHAVASHAVVMQEGFLAVTT